MVEMRRGDNLAGGALPYRDIDRTIKLYVVGDGAWRLRKKAARIRSRKTSIESESEMARTRASRISYARPAQSFTVSITKSGTCG